MRKIALLDLDGTLLDTPNAIAHEMAAVVTEHRGSQVPASAARELIGLPLPHMLARLAGLPETCGDVEQLVEDYRSRFRERIVPAAPSLVFPGVDNGLRQLRACGFRLGVVTSKQHDSAVTILQSANLLHLFDDVVGVDDTTRPKPSADPARLALRRLGAAPEEGVVVGDTVHDVAMGLAVPMRTVAVTYGVDRAEQLHAAGADRVVDTFDDVVAHLLDLLAPVAPGNRSREGSEVS